jgi:hypothetical protein
LSLKHKKFSIKTICLYLLLVVILGWGLASCGDRPEISSSPVPQQPSAPTRLTSNLTEVAPPSILVKLRESLEKYQPQVTIVAPQADQTLSDTKVSVQLKVRDLPIFKNEQLELGPHLHLFLDNQPYVSIYDLNQPITFDKLSPGTHTLRVFAVNPWEESFKNEGAYAQTSFHIFTKTQENNPDATKPLLTYSQPQGEYGAEPIMLDFYLTNAPLHLVAQNSREDSINDWRIKVTINGGDFILDEWKPAYLKGFKEGNNWVQLQFIDEQGNPVDNVFNDTVRVINYKPKGNDPLSKLIRGELPLELAQGMVDPNYQIPSVGKEGEAPPTEVTLPETEETIRKTTAPTETFSGESAPEETENFSPTPAPEVQDDGETDSKSAVSDSSSEQGREIPPSETVQEESQPAPNSEIREPLDNQS